MSVVKVCAVSMIGKMTVLDQVVSVCEALADFHPDNALSFFSDTKGFVTLNEPNPYAPALQRLREAVSLAGKTLSGSAVRQLPEDADLMEYANRYANAMMDFRSRQQALLQEKEAIARSVEELDHFVGLNVDINEMLQCRYIKVRFGRLPRESLEKMKAYNDNPYVLFFPATSTQEFSWGVYFAPLENVAEVDRIFSSLYFERIRLPASVETPEHAIEELKVQQAEAEAKLAALNDEIEAYFTAEYQNSLCAEKELERLSLIAETKKYAAQYGDNFVLTGWVPESETKEFFAQLDAIPSVEYTTEKAEGLLRNSPPVKLKNPKLFKPFEFFVNLYGLPSYNEVDPTPLVALTYTVLFGIMFGDVGQGLVLSLVGWLMWRLKKMQLGRILIPCGISAAVFGLVFGSVFGFEHVLDPMYRALGFAEKPVEVTASGTMNTIIFSAVGIGCALVITAMLINIYSCVKQKNIGSALFGANGAAGLVFYGSVVLFAVQMLMGLSLVPGTVLVVLLCVSLLLLFLSEPLVRLVNREPDWMPEKPVEFLMQSFFELFETVLSYVTNTMSFLRVGAFVLVHAGMMMVVFTLAEMSSGVGYLLVVVIGNIVVMGMEGLLVGIQVLRLEFYEIFSRFFKGDGRPFRAAREAAVLPENK
ncbi:MAG: V-type ATPase 116kDa subunit family protein [Firmicutes bacterium]|nr:V-type ATPase 116kDa subunit family protein [Bacillota bacterium]